MADMLLVMRSLNFLATSQENVFFYADDRIIESGHQSHKDIEIQQSYSPAILPQSALLFSVRRCPNWEYNQLLELPMAFHLAHQLLIFPVLRTHSLRCYERGSRWSRTCSCVSGLAVFHQRSRLKPDSPLARWDHK